jgi:hypothetical protein
MLADEITGDLRATRQQAMDAASRSNHTVTKTLTSKGINYGTISATKQGNTVIVDTLGVSGVNPDYVCGLSSGMGERSQSESFW